MDRCTDDFRLVCPETSEEAENLSQRELVQDDVGGLLVYFLNIVTDALVELCVFFGVEDLGWMKDEREMVSDQPPPPPATLAEMERAHVTGAYKL